MDAEPTDVELLERAREGDPQALEALLERHQGRVYRFGMRMCRDPEDARDVLQETLLALARGIRDFRGASSLSTWLYTVARSHCIKKRRRGKFEPTAVQSLDEHAAAETPAAGAATDPEEHAARRQIERALQEAIARLEPGARDVLVLRDVEGLTAPEVAEVLETTPAAVKSRLHRARMAIRAQILPLIEPAAVPRPAPSCPDVLMQFSRHLEGEISADLCADLERHLQGCPRCRAACDSLKHTLRVCRTHQADVEVPAAVQASVKVALRDLLGEKT